jgi:hypothetical protein
MNENEFWNNLDNLSIVKNGKNEEKVGNWLSNLPEQQNSKSFDDTGSNKSATGYFFHFFFVIVFKYIMSIRNLSVNIVCRQNK